jgi:hypothetical protein
MATNTQRVEGGWMDVIDNAIYNSNENSRTAYPARVVGVSGRFNVTVEISNPRKADDGSNMDDTHVINVPIAQMRTANSAFLFPVRVGDTGMCVVMDNNTDNFKIANNTAPIMTYDNRMKDIMDSVFVPGLAPFAVTTQQINSLSLSNDPNDLVIVHNTGTGQETQFVLKADGNAVVESQFTVKVIGKDIDLSASNSITLNAPTMNINVASTSWTGNTAVSGAWTFNGILFDTHKHTGVAPGNGVSGLPVA